jgi:hypothetical protein
LAADGEAIPNKRFDFRAAQPRGKAKCNLAHLLDASTLIKTPRFARGAVFFLVNHFRRLSATCSFSIWMALAVAAN